CGISVPWKKPARMVTGTNSGTRTDGGTVKMRPMFAYVGVVEHPFFAVTGADGTFRLPPDLPPGTYGLEAVHPKAGTAMQEITVTGSDRKTVDFTLRVPNSP